jgi:hypothetical protein
VHFSLLPIRAICPDHRILLDFTTSTILGKEYRSFSSSLCNFYIMQDYETKMSSQTVQYCLIILRNIRLVCR